MAETTFKAEYAKTNRSNCKKCKSVINKGEFRIGKLTPSPFSEGDSMAQWHHPNCLFQTFQKVRATTKIIEEPDDLEGYGDLEEDDKKALLKLIESIKVLTERFALYSFNLQSLFVGKDQSEKNPNI